MSFWSRPSTTSGLLAVNAVLLLVIVIQNASHSGGPPPAPMAMDGGAPMSAPFAGHPPMGGGMQGGAPGMDGNGPDQNFDPTLMIMAAMVCPGDATLTLDSQNCSGKDADKRRDAVHALYQKESSIRSVFDGVVKQFGENALSEQAKQIRRSRRAQQ